MSLCGRRRECLVWTYFEYNDSTNITTCKVMGQNGTCCLKKLTEKNSSNLKSLIAHIVISLREIIFHAILLNDNDNDN